MTSMNVTRFIIIAIVASSIDLAAEWILTHSHLSQPARIAVASAPIPGNIILIVLVVRASGVRCLGTAFDAAACRGFQSGGKPPHSRAFMLITYAIGYAVAIRQYA